ACELRAVLETEHRVHLALLRFHLFCDRSDRLVGRQRRALLPAGQITEMLASKMNRTIRSHEDRIIVEAGLARPFGPCPSAVRHLFPADDGPAPDIAAILRVDLLAAHERRIQAIGWRHLSE